MSTKLADKRSHNADGRERDSEGRFVPEKGSKHKSNERSEAARNRPRDAHGRFKD